MQKKIYTGPERRKSPRKEIELKIEYSLSEELEKKNLAKIRVAHSSNISGEGLCIYFNEDTDFKEGSQLYMIINLPDKKKVFAITQVVYINPAEKEGYKYRIGFRYLELAEEDRKTIMDFAGGIKRLLVK